MTVIQAITLASLLIMSEVTLFAHQQKWVSFWQVMPLFLLFCAGSFSY